MLQVYAEYSAWCDRFQSSSAPKDGCCAREAGLVEVLENISILIRPEGRMLPATEFLPGVPDDLISILIRPEGRMLLETDTEYVRWLIISILIRPEGRMLPATKPL